MKAEEKQKLLKPKTITDSDPASRNRETNKNIIN
jgi:hypothetical protein